jgi:wobble nucleotide-excising tRNase
MIKRIELIKEFGIFKDFNWNSIPDIQDFKEKNVFYGWNYSGKTTISRIFSSLRDKHLHEKCQKGEFKIIFDNDKKIITQDNLDKFEYGVQVFNSEFIKQNLKWDTRENLDAISFDVGKNVGTRQEIENNQNRIDLIKGTDKIKGKKEIYQPDIDEFNKFEDSKFTLEASYIKNKVFNSLIEFNKGHLKVILTQVEKSLKSFVISDDAELIETKKTALATNDKIKIDDLSYTPCIKSIYDKIAEILLSEPPQSEIIEVLDNNNNLYDWTKKGYELHYSSGKTVCSFCGNLIPEQRYILLKNYFSNESAKLRLEIVECRELIKNEVDAFNNINIPKSKNDLSDKCHIAYDSQIEKLKSIKKNYLSFLKSLNSELDRKENGNIFNPLTIIPIGSTIESSMIDWISNTQKIITAHNDFVENFKTEQLKARERLKKHLVADFLQREKYLDKVKSFNYAKECIRLYDCLILKIQNRNDDLLAKLKDIVAGKEELNKFIKAFLNRDDINIDVTIDDKFILQRGKEYADNLSEGEKTAISFAYFLVTLESLHREKKLKNTIIFIDDPISSLDANHIAQVYSLINSFFFRKGEDVTQPETAINCFKQLFISTHNFEFFSFLKDSNQITRKQKSNPVTGCEFYLVKRIDNNNASINPLPKSLKLKSEYVYLFEILYNFHKEGCSLENDKFILIPNALRRFFEIYTLIKLPDSKGEIDSRINILMGGPNNLKLLHHFSHFTSFEKLTKHDELVMNLPEAMEELMTLLKKDSSHYESLKRAINE